MTHACSTFLIYNCGGGVPVTCEMQVIATCEDAVELSTCNPLTKTSWSHAQTRPKLLNLNTLSLRSLSSEGVSSSLGFIKILRCSLFFLFSHHDSVAPPHPTQKKTPNHSGPNVQNVATAVEQVYPLLFECQKPRLTWGRKHLVFAPPPPSPCLYFKDTAPFNMTNGLDVTLDFKIFPRIIKSFQTSILRKRPFAVFEEEAAAGSSAGWCTSGSKQSSCSFFGCSVCMNSTNDARLWAWRRRLNAELPHLVPPFSSSSPATSYSFHSGRLQLRPWLVSDVCVDTEDYLTRSHVCPSKYKSQHGLPAWINDMWTQQRSVHPSELC